MSWAHTDSCGARLWVPACRSAITNVQSRWCRVQSDPMSAPYSRPNFGRGPRRPPCCPAGGTAATIFQHLSSNPGTCKLAVEGSTAHAQLPPAFLAPQHRCRSSQTLSMDVTSWHAADGAGELGRDRQPSRGSFRSADTCRRVRGPASGSRGWN